MPSAASTLRLLAVLVGPEPPAARGALPLPLAGSFPLVGVGVPGVWPRELARLVPRADRRHAARLVEPTEVVGDLVPREVAASPPDGLTDPVEPTPKHGRRQFRSAR
jgi:hypothetical protein